MMQRSANRTKRISFGVIYFLLSVISLNHPSAVLTDESTENNRHYYVATYGDAMSTHLNRVKSDEQAEISVWPEKPLPPSFPKLHKPQSVGIPNDPAKKDVQTDLKPRPKPSHAHYAGFKYFVGEPIPALALRPTNPKRPPGWRWDVARNMVEAPSQRVQRCVDDPAALAIALQKFLRRCRNEDHLWKIFEVKKPYPQMFEALEIWREDDLFRAELEARVLAREEPEAIAQKLGVSPEVIKQFELLFFDVRGWLDRPGYIMHTVLGAKIHADLSPTDVPLLWKFAGYSSGNGAVLDMLITGHPSSRNAAANENLAEFFRQDVQRTLVMKSWIAMRTLPADDPKVAARLVQQLVSLEQQKQKRQMRSCTPTGVDIEKNVSAFFSVVERSYQNKEFEELYERMHPDRSQSVVTENTQVSSASPIDIEEDPLIL